MEFALMFMLGPGTPVPDEAPRVALAALADELAGEGILRRDALLSVPVDAACVRRLDGELWVCEGPFTGSQDRVSGLWVLDVLDREAAVEVALRVASVTNSTVQLQRLAFRGAFAEIGKNPSFLLLFRMDGSADSSVDMATMGREMRTFGEPLARDGTMPETGRLADRESSVRVEVRAGKPVVMDGPFAESKEAIGGYAIVRTLGRTEAIELAGEFPHARWGTVEVRAIEPVRRD